MQVVKKCHMFCWPSQVKNLWKLWPASAAVIAVLCSPPMRGQQSLLQQSCQQAARLRMCNPSRKGCQLQRVQPTKAPLMNLQHP
mmetsp:Transcript_100394/g.282103  ORF Transcript_100394/g.282103 Transcript_100394/m.282103 type:complete len:84 (-) Transcript_100394:1107-1358(-)